MCVCVFVFYNYFAASIVVVGLYTELAALAAFFFFVLPNVIDPNWENLQENQQRKKIK